MSAVTIGALRRRLQLEAPVDIPDQAGGFSRAWTFVAEIWGEVRALRAESQFVAAQESMRATHRIAIRWRPDIDGAMRFRDGARAFRILGVQDADSRRERLVCQCEETRA